jgi:alcohol dehydrogenase
MAYASLISGICLAHTGLGSVHGLASPLGAFFPIPHGLCCGTLVAEATDVNIRALREREPEGPALEKYARVGELLAQTNVHDRNQCLAALVETLRAWTERLSLARLGDYGMKPEDMARVVAGCRGGSMKTNPIVLTDAEVETIVARRL